MKKTIVLAVLVCAMGVYAQDWPETHPEGTTGYHLSIIDNEYRVYVWRGDCEILIEVEPVAGPCLFISAAFVLWQDGNRQNILFERVSGQYQVEEITETTVFRIYQTTETINTDEAFTVMHDGNGVITEINIEASTGCGPSDGDGSGGSDGGCYIWTVG